MKKRLWEWIKTPKVKKGKNEAYEEAIVVVGHASDEEIEGLGGTKTYLRGAPTNLRESGIQNELNFIVNLGIPALEVHLYRPGKGFTEADLDLWKQICKRRGIKVVDHR